MRPSQNPDPDGGSIHPIRRRQNAGLDDDTLVGAYKTDMRLHQDRSENTTITYESHLGTFRRWLEGAHPDVPLPDVLAYHVKAFLLAQAARGIAPGTRSTILWALRSFYRYLLSEELIPINPTDKITVPGARKIRTEFYTDSEADLILAWAKDQPDIRWQVGYPLLATLRYGGLRRNEIATQRTDQVDLKGRRITVVGKGRKTRTVPIPAPLVAILTHYLCEVRPTLSPSAFFFANPLSRPNGNYVGRFNHQAVDALVKAAGTGAGMQIRDFAHRWRHTYATSLLRRGTDIHVVQRVLGHSSINTTTRYLHLDDTDLLDAVDQAFPDE